MDQPHDGGGVTASRNVVASPLPMG